jgi:hypothetical protein
VCCASAGAERRGGVLCAGPAYVVTPQAKRKGGERRCCASAGADRPECGICAGPAYVVPQREKKKKDHKDGARCSMRTEDITL